MIVVMTEKNPRKLPPMPPRPGDDEKNKNNSNINQNPKRKKRSNRAHDDVQAENDDSSRLSSREHRTRSTSNRRSRSTPESTPRSPGGGSVRSKGASPRRSRSKSRQKKSFSTSREELIDSNSLESPKGRSPRKHKKHKKSAINEVGLASTLQDISDDVIETEISEDDSAKKYYNTTPVTMQSEYGNRIFIEQKSGFKSTDRVKLAKYQAEQQLRAQEQPLEIPSTTTLEFGLATQKIFRNITLFLHGIFAGFGLWHIVSIFVFYESSDYNTFLTSYYKLGMPVQCLYYFLFVMCIVSVFDRYDLAGVNTAFLVRALTLQNGAISALIYVISLCFSLGIASTDDKIGQFVRDPTLWANQQESEDELTTWRYLSIVRGIGPILGWIIISLRPGTDRLSKNLRKADAVLAEQAQNNMQSPDNQQEEGFNQKKSAL